MDLEGDLALQSSVLPGMLRGLLWDYDWKELSWEEDRDLILARVLSAGSWDAVTWLRSQVTDRELREWLARRHGAGLSPQRLRFWELVLELPHDQVNTWLAEERRKTWDVRASR
jgi:hypothetical protein